MSEANKTTTRRFFEALGTGDVETLKTLITDDMEVTTPGTAKICATRDYATVLQTCAAFPLVTQNGIRFEFTYLTAEDDRVAAEALGHSVMINGKPYNNTYHFLVFFRDGRICRIKEYLDTKLGDEVLGPFLP